MTTAKKLLNFLEQEQGKDFQKSLNDYINHLKRSHVDITTSENPKYPDIVYIKDGDKMLVLIQKSTGDILKPASRMAPPRPTGANVFKQDTWE